MSSNVNVLKAVSSLGAKSTSFYGNNSELIRRLCSTTNIDDNVDHERSITETGMGGASDEAVSGEVEPDNFENALESDETILTKTQLAGLIAEYAKNQGHDVQENAESTASTSFESLKPAKVTFLRNAGRKKTHPVWHFFKDLRDLNGIGGVNCLHCSWSGEDRSPNNLKTHLKRFHESDGIYERFSLMLSKTPTQPYVKRNRGVNNSLPTSTAAGNFSYLQSIATNASNIAHQADHNDEHTNNAAANDLPRFLASIPKSEEVINVSAGGAFPKNNDGVESSSPSSSNGHSKEDDDASSNGQDQADPPNKRAKRESDCEVESGTSPVPSIESQPSANGAIDLPMAFGAGADLQTALSLVKNPAVWAALQNPTAASSFYCAANKLPNIQPAVSIATIPAVTPIAKTNFCLSGGDSLAMLFELALELECTLTCHARRGQQEFCFESNRTAERSGGRGRQLCLTEQNDEILVCDRVNGAITDTETWKKTDFFQFKWAIRGRCQKTFK
ncbi:hypothetical protein QR680_015224 [Steinernema hermaphroditum]|uniref:BED-type domain-containing protein n=1 Tax=Steinernema hermaphroditum TaxID=289476 RepID=A0AA39M577_9BILA|nr:hypothetical protein QR680_015224 [Steinernema hermaphroditum]